MVAERRDGVATGAGVSGVLRVCGAGAGRIRRCKGSAELRVLSQGIGRVPAEVRRCARVGGPESDAAGVLREHVRGGGDAGEMGSRGVGEARGAGAEDGLVAIRHSPFAIRNLLFAVRENQECRYDSGVAEYYELESRDAANILRLAGDETNRLTRARARAL